jgi:hypothetical protein
MTSYQEEILLQVDPIPMAPLTMILRDANGIEQTPSADSLSPPVTVTPFTDIWLQFGRPLSSREFNAAWASLVWSGSLDECPLNPDSGEVAVDSSAVHGFAFRSRCPWSEFWGLSSLRIDLNWFSPNAAFVHFRHPFTGITHTDSNCHLIGAVDSLDWDCTPDTRSIALCLPADARGGRVMPAGDRFPVEAVLNPPCPNPVAPGEHTTLSFATPSAAQVRILIINTEGYLVRTLIDGYLAAGYHSAWWDLRDDGGQPVPEGIYHILWHQSEWGFMCSGDLQIDHTYSGVVIPVAGSEEDGLIISPNPTAGDPSLRVRWTIQRPAAVELELLDAGGRLVRRFLQGRFTEPGDYSTVWDRRNDQGVPVTNGVYFARCRIGRRDWTTSLVLVR